MEIVTGVELITNHDNGWANWQNMETMKIKLNKSYTWHINTIFSIQNVNNDVIVRSTVLLHLIESFVAAFTAHSCDWCHHNNVNATFHYAEPKPKTSTTYSKTSTLFFCGLASAGISFRKCKSTWKIIIINIQSILSTSCR